jgi:hypothetical protein
MKIEFINASEVNPGDTIMIEGIANTISQKFIKYDPIFGITINGIKMRGKIERVLFLKWHKGNLLGYFPQI